MRIIDQEVVLLSPFSDDDVYSGIRMIEMAGRNCYASPESDTYEGKQKFVSTLIRRGHESPLEFMDFIFLITTSRDVMAQLTRHRLASYCIQSQRYVKANKDGDIEFIKPLFYDDQDNTFLAIRWRADMESTEDAYNHMLMGGATPEDARKVLPNSTATRIMMKVNARELRHIFKLRLDKAAYPEMRVLAGLMLDAVSNVPVLFDEFRKAE